MKKYIALLGFIPTIAFADDDCATMRTVPAEQLDLRQVIDLGLCRNPQTAAAYAGLRAARFDKNTGYANYLPKVNASLSAGKNYNQTHNKEWGDWNYSASISASYLIFDFGKRLADLNQTIATYRATGFDYDETVQNFVYSVIGAYYELLNGYFDDYDLWIRNVYFKPGIEIRDDWKYWQYTDTAVYNFYQGSEQHIDLDVYNGNIESFLKYNGIGM